MATTYTYDADGNLTSKVMPAQNQTGTATVTLSYCYDALNRLTSKAYTQQSCPMPSPVATYSYDQSPASANPIGRRTGMVDPAGSAVWTYDTMGRALTEQRTTTTGTPLPLSSNCTSTTAAANILDLKYNFNLGTSDNGNVMRITNNRDTTRS